MQKLVEYAPCHTTMTYCSSSSTSRSLVPNQPTATSVEETRKTWRIDRIKQPWFPLLQNRAATAPLQVCAITSTNLALEPKN
jgi:hypothetical protein